jgi:hypothetical protein
VTEMRIRGQTLRGRKKFVARSGTEEVAMELADVGCIIIVSFCGFQVTKLRLSRAVSL